MGTNSRNIPECPLIFYERSLACIRTGHSISTFRSVCNWRVHGERTRAIFFGTGMNSRSIRMPTFVYKSFFGIRKSKRTMLAHFLSNAERNIILEHAEAVYYIVNDGEGGSLPPLFWCFLPCCPPRFPASPGLTAAGLFLHPAHVQGGKYLWLPGKVEHTFCRRVLNCATR